MTKTGDILTETELNEAVHGAQARALRLGQIPIAGVVSRKVGGNKHEVLGVGNNLLRSGIPGVHGETGALINTGRLERFRDWAGVTITSSLNPCNFCQRTMCCHLGIRSVRILDTKNLVVPPLGYARAGVTPELLHHDKTAEVFGKWVADPVNSTVWNRDIGIYEVPTPPPFDLALHPRRAKVLLGLLDHHARLAYEAGEAPMAALILDAWGEVLSVGQPRIRRDNDPTKTAAMTAWRNAGARDHWKDKTLLLSTGPDHIAYAMFQVFNFGQLALPSPPRSSPLFPGTLPELKKTPTPITLLKSPFPADKLFKKWLNQSDPDTLREYLGADYKPL